MEGHTLIEITKESDDEEMEVDNQSYETDQNEVSVHLGDPNNRTYKTIDTPPPASDCL